MTGRRLLGALELRSDIALYLSFWCFLPLWTVSTDRFQIFKPLHHWRISSSASRWIFSWKLRGTNSQIYSIPFHSRSDRPCHIQLVFLLTTISVPWHSRALPFLMPRIEIRPPLRSTTLPSFLWGRGSLFNLGKFYLFLFNWLRDLTFMISTTSSTLLITNIGSCVSTLSSIWVLFLRNFDRYFPWHWHGLYDLVNFFFL